MVEATYIENTVLDDMKQANIILRQLKGVKARILSTIADENGTILCKPREVRDRFVRHFQKVFNAFFPFRCFGGVALIHG